MLKYLETEVTFLEIPDEITLCINITGCPCRCIGCHSPHLAEDIGEPLGYQNFVNLVNNNKGITCVAFMGGDSDPDWLATLAFKSKREFPKLKIAWYSGRQELPKNFPIKYFDFIKLGPYVEEKGPLNNPNTNQRLYEIKDEILLDITYKFWKNGASYSLQE